jgi:ribosomal protein S18 acetylase RimI-like enzyme
MTEEARIVLLEAPLAEEYNAFMRRGVRAHPDTLRIAEADIVAAPFAVAPTPDKRTLVALVDGGAWAGTVSVERELGRVKRQHIAWVVRMYVAREYGGRGIGARLLLRAIAEGRAMPGVSKLNLTVAAHNEHAVRLYERHGFREFSREPDAFRDPEPRTELSMTLAL